MKPATKQRLVRDKAIKFVSAKSIDRDLEKHSKNIDYFFEAIADFMRDPIRPELYIQNWGTFRIRPYLITRYLQDQLAFLKSMKKAGLTKENSVKYASVAENFRHWWEKRDMGINFYLNMKSKIHKTDFKALTAI